MQIETFFDPATSTLTYVVFDAHSRDAVVIDPVLDYDPLSSSTATRSLDAIAAFVRRHELRVHYSLETHAHADHLSGGQYLRRHFGAKIGIGARIREVQAVFRDVFDLPPWFRTDGGQFDRLFQDGETIAAGTLAFEVIATPGHTPACVSYRFADAVFVGDALFVEDSGTGRCDFPAGSASALFTSIHDRLYALPDATRVFVGHDYQPNGRSLRYETTIGASKTSNVQLRDGTTREEFVRLRTARDATLAPPRLLFPSVQVNVDAGAMPRPHANGRRYLVIPLDASAANEERSLFDLATPSTRGYRDVRPEQVARRTTDARIIDVREPNELDDELSHIPGVEHVPLATIADASRSWRADDVLVLVCRSGRRSERAAAMLSAAGFRRVMNMVGGMQAWNDARLPVARARSAS